MVRFGVTGHRRGRRPKTTVSTVTGPASLQFTTAVAPNATSQPSLMHAPSATTQQVERPAASLSMVRHDPAIGGQQSYGAYRHDSCRTTAADRLDADNPAGMTTARTLAASPCNSRDLPLSSTYLFSSHYELSNELGLSYDDARQLLLRVSTAQLPPVQTVSDIVSSTKALLTSTLLDEVLKGGLPCGGCICEITGPPGAGKSRFCIMVAAVTARDAVHTALVRTAHANAAAAAIPESKLKDIPAVVYVATAHGTFSSIAAAEMLVAMGGDAESSPDEILNVLRAIDSLLVDSCDELHDVLQRLMSIGSGDQGRGLRLLVVDCITDLMLRDFDASDIKGAAERNGELLRLLDALKRVGETCGCAIVLVNNSFTATVDLGGGFGGAGGPRKTSAALGVAFHHGVNIRIIIDGGKLVVEKSPMCPRAELLCSMCDSGVRLSRTALDS